MNSYNGWANWATWNVNLWMNNDERSYNLIRKNLPITPESAKALVAEVFPPYGVTPDMEDILDLCDVDWEEIAIMWNEDYQP